MHTIKNRFSVIAALALLLDGGLAGAQDTGSLVVPIRVVDGHIMVIGYVTNINGDINDVSLEVSFEHPGIFTLDGNQYGWLENPAIVKLLLKPDVQLQFPAAEVKEETRAERSEMHDRMTRFFSNKLDEHKVKGVLGAGFLRKYHVALDVAAGTMTLSPPEAGRTAGGEVVRHFQLREGRLYFPIQYGVGKTGEMMLGGDVYDTYIDSAVAQREGKPAGDISPIWLGDEGRIDLASQIALRPRAVKAGVPEATVVAGVNLLEAFRVEVDWSSSTVAFTPSVRKEYPKADLAYFQAEAAGTLDALQSYLEIYPTARLSAEAANKLIAGRIEAKASDEELMKALKWVAQTSPPERQMENCTVFVKSFRRMPDRAPLVVESGLFALTHSRGAVSVQDTYRLHNIIGEAYLKQDKVNEAWRHFLSAAFMPLDNKSDLVHNIAVQYNLACSYDRMGRYTRAYSRYIKTQEMIAPIEEQVMGMDEKDKSMPEDVREQVILLKTAIAKLKEALPRLKKEIPADELEMLEG